MDKHEPKRHKDSIEPDSREHTEHTNAIYQPWDEVDHRIKERSRREREAVRIEQGRRVREGLPLEDNCYFARLTKGMYVRDEDLHNLWEKDRVAVHLTESGLDSGPSQHGELDPKNYPGNERLMVWTLLQLSKMGGYVWFENRLSTGAKVGVVKPGTRIKGIEARWSETNHPKYKGKAGTATTLRTLRLESVRPVHLMEATMLRASRPVVPDHVGLNNLRRWEPACGESRLISLVEDENKSLEVRWNDLPLDLQLMVCTDFLRYHDNPNYPSLKRVLLTPTTMNSKDVDIYGMAEDGTEIMAQTPFRHNREREGFEARKKAQQLMKYCGSGVKLICFIPGFRSDLEDAGQNPKLFEDRSPIVQNGVQLIPVQEVLDWIEGQPAYADKLLRP